MFDIDYNSLLLASAFFGSFFNKPKLGNQSGKILPLKEAIPSYSDVCHIQASSLQRSLDTFTDRTDTSLDVILSKSLVALKTSLLQYSKLLEQILLAKGVLNSVDNTRRRNLQELMSLAKERLAFPYGEKIMLAAKFLVKMQTAYLSSEETEVYVKYIKAVKQEFVLLDEYIEQN